MRSGDLDKRITIQTRSETKDTYGQRIATWTDIAPPVWANVRPIGGRERLAAMAYESAMTHTVSIRYDARFLPVTTADSHRILYGTRTFQVISARDLDEARRWIIFDCVEGPHDG